MNEYYVLCIQRGLYSSGDTKGHLISECLIDVLNFPKKQRKFFIALILSSYLIGSASAKQFK